MKSGFFLLILSALLVLWPDSDRSAAKDASDCTFRADDGGQWLQSLCEAIREIAAGDREREIELGRNDATSARVKLWRNLNGTTVDIDFRYGTVGSHVIARLLSGSAFIPVDRVDQLVIRNAVLDGTLDLSHATIEVATKFDRLVFNSRQRKCSPPTPEPEADALVLVGAEVKKRLSVENSIFCGDLRIASTRLHGGLQLGHGPDSANDRLMVPTSLGSLFVVKSRIKGEVFIGHVEATGRVRFDRDTVDAITIVSSVIQGPVQVADNRLGSLSVWSSSFGEEISIEDNAIASSMNLRVMRFLGKEPPVIRDNDIDGGLQITLRELAAKDANFSHNTVDRSAEIWLIPAWRGSLDLNGSVFGSRLALCLARFDGEKGTLRPIPAEVGTGLEDGCHEPEVAPIFGMATAMAAEKAVDVTVNLRSVAVGALAWRLPLNCSFRWAGSGLRYQHWEETTTDLSDSNFECREASPSEGQRNPTLIGSTDGLMLMRHLMNEGDVDALNTMADYLESRGKIVESRDVREEAKRANYLDVPEQADLFDLDAWSRWAASRALAPVGYGAKPELALIWLFLTWLLSYCVYRSYSYARRIDWQEKLAKDSAKTIGYSLQPGFMQFDKEKDPKDFDILRYSIDAMLPVINLHTYDRYYPEHLGLRLYAALQHALGWFLITIFLVSAAIL